MPQLVLTAFEIAFERGQDILLVDFRRPKNRESYFPNATWDRKARAAFVKWMKEELPDIQTEIAFPPPSRGTLIEPWSGHLAIIVSESRQPHAYRTIVERSENADGTPRAANVKLYIVPKPDRAPVFDDNF